MSNAASPFERQDGVLMCEQVSLPAIAQRFGTPTYVYSRRAIESGYRAWADALAGRAALVCFAMKANCNLAVLDLLARAGCGFDIVSGGELARVLAAGGAAGKVVFSGVGKTDDEIEAALAAGILCFNVESAHELDQLDRIARAHGVQAPLSLRVNPDVDARTHPYISTGLKDNKFGVPIAAAAALYQRAAAAAGLRVVGVDCHIGSQITELGPYLDTVERMLDLVDRLRDAGIGLHHLDFGGGLGIRYRDESPPTPRDLVAAVLARVDARGHGDKTVLFEPGRSIVGASGVLLARVLQVKRGATKNFAVVDAAMNDLMRPALYDSWIDVQPVELRAATSAAAGEVVDVVGPVCESSDWLARDRVLALAAGDLIAIGECGAYGMSMASNYNSRPRAAEVMVDGERMHLIRRRETVTELFAGEARLP